MYLSMPLTEPNVQCSSRRIPSTWSCVCCVVSVRARMEPLHHPRQDLLQICCRLSTCNARGEAFRLPPCPLQKKASLPDIGLRDSLKSAQRNCSDAQRI